MSEKKRNWFNQHKVLTVIGVLVGFIVLIGMFGDKPQEGAARSTDTPAATSEPQEKKEAPAVRKVTGKAVTIGAGTFKGGADVATGLYDVTTAAGQSGNFIVHGSNSYNEILGDAGAAGGVSKIRVQISEGDEIQISGLSTVVFTPVTAKFVTAHAKTTLYAGTFMVGEDVGAGRYSVTPGAGQSGNFIVHGANSYNEILGGDSAFGGVPSVSATLADGDMVTISGLDEVVFAPIK